MRFKEFFEAYDDGDHANLYSISLYQSAPKFNGSEFGAKGIRSKYVASDLDYEKSSFKPNKIFGFKKKRKV
jgi:hypothetical protein